MPGWYKPIIIIIKQQKWKHIEKMSIIIEYKIYLRGEVKSRYSRGISKIVLTSRVGNQWYSPEICANLCASWMPENGNAMPRVSSSGPLLQRRRTLMQPLFISSQTPDHYHFKLVSLHTQACARQLRAAKKTRENNPNILSRWWQTQKRGWIVFRAFSPFPTIRHDEK